MTFTLDLIVVYSAHEEKTVQRRFTFEVMKESVFYEPDDGNWSLPLVQKKAGSGKTAQGEDFFGKLDKWLAKLEEIHGKDHTSAEWKRFVTFSLLTRPS